MFQKKFFFFFLKNKYKEKEKKRNKLPSLKKIEIDKKNKHRIE